MKRIFHLLPAAAVTPALAHDLEAAHSHMGETVLFHLSPLLVVGAGIAAVAAIAILRITRGKKSGR